MAEKDSTGQNLKDALKADWEQTKSDLPGLEGRDTDQSIGDTVRQARGERAPGERAPSEQSPRGQQPPRR